MASASSERRPQLAIGADEQVKGEGMREGATTGRPRWRVGALLATVAGLPPHTGGGDSNGRGRSGRGRCMQRVEEEEEGKRRRQRQQLPGAEEEEEGGGDGQQSWQMEAVGKVCTRAGKKQRGRRGPSWRFKRRVRGRMRRVGCSRLDCDESVWHRRPARVLPTGSDDVVTAVLGTCDVLCEPETAAERPQGGAGVVGWAGRAIGRPH